jgi:hypothetical protein
VCFRSSSDNRDSFFFCFLFFFVFCIQNDCFKFFRLNKAHQAIAALKRGATQRETELKQKQSLKEQPSLVLSPSQKIWRLPNLKVLHILYIYINRFPFFFSISLIFFYASLISFSKHMETS